MFIQLQYSLKNNTFIQQEHFKLIKSEHKHIYNVAKGFHFLKNAVLLNFLLKKYRFHKYIKQNCLQH